MIPENFKDILRNSQDSAFLGTLALVLFVLFFSGLIYVTLMQPKKRYNEVEGLPLDQDETNFNL
jgi:cytochrome c oxidase cbb3-type subunit IV